VYSIILKRLYFVILILSCLSLATCGGVSGSGATGAGADGGGGSYDDPVSIPVTISKLIDGVDATSVQLTDVSSSINAVTKHASTDTFGTVSFTLQDTSSEKEVALIYNDEVQDTVTTSKGSGSFTILDSVVGTNLAIAVGDATDTSTTTGTWSPPVIVTPYEDDLDVISSASSKYINVTITNTDADSSGELKTANIQPVLAMEDGDTITFFAEDDSSSFIGKVPAVGGEDITEFVSDLSYEVQQMIYDSSGRLYGIHSKTGQLLRFDTSGELDFTEDNSQDLVPENETRRYAFSPNEEWVVLERLKSSSSDVTEVRFINLEDTDTVYDPTITGASNGGAIPSTWIDNNTVFGFVYTGQGGEQLDVTDVLAGTTTTLTSTLVFNDDGTEIFYISSLNAVVYMNIPA
jgi:hypothetical protein